MKLKNPSVTDVIKTETDITLFLSSNSKQISLVFKNEKEFSQFIGELESNSSIRCSNY